MPFLIIPLLLIAMLVLWLVLLPLSLWQRYRYGKARRMARPWLVTFNAWGLLLSVIVFFVISAISEVWWPASLSYAAAGAGIGVIVGGLGLAITRFDITPQGLFYRPNPWLTLALTLLIAGRIVMGFVQVYRQWPGGEAERFLAALDHASLLSVAGLLLGYYLAYAWGLRWRLTRLARLLR
ncbi:DUF1453 domain-containing protein [Pseudoxanthomonas sp. UTMC 1351]|uniref:DUF1453 domain-containing protein n=1 Tax=Pseudoxanthomonas sp. UTMC 1351 TaxID=2695853 RepID=UPI0034CDFA48